MKKELFKKVHTRIIHAGGVGCVCQCGSNTMVNSSSYVSLHRAKNQ